MTTRRFNKMMKIQASPAAHTSIPQCERCSVPAHAEVSKHERNL
jgi:hypothetical protein